MSALWRIFLMRFWRSLSGILACNPNPFPSLKGCVCLVGSASCRAFWHTRPASVPGLLSGAAAPATLLGASPQTPFIVYKEVFLQSGSSVDCSAEAFLFSVFHCFVQKSCKRIKLSEVIEDKLQKTAVKYGIIIISESSEAIEVFSVVPLIYNR